MIDCRGVWKPSSEILVGVAIVANVRQEARVQSYRLLLLLLLRDGLFETSLLARLFWRFVKQEQVHRVLLRLEQQLLLCWQMEERGSQHNLGLWCLLEALGGGALAQSGQLLLHLVPVGCRLAPLGLALPLPLSLPLPLPLLCAAHVPRSSQQLALADLKACLVRLVRLGLVLLRHPVPLLDGGAPAGDVALELGLVVGGCGPGPGPGPEAATPALRRHLRRRCCRNCCEASQAGQHTLGSVNWVQDAVAHGEACAAAATTAEQQQHSVVILLCVRERPV